MLSLSSLHRSAFGFASSRVEEQYASHLDAVALRWLIQWIVMATAAGFSEIIISGRVESDDSFARLKGLIHISLFLATIIYWLVVKDRRRPILGAKQVVALTLTLERAYHILYIFKLAAWTPLAARLTVLQGKNEFIFDMLASLVAPSIGIPLQMRDQVMLRVAMEILQAVYLMTVSHRHGIQVSVVMKIMFRFSLSICIGLATDAMRREAFLKSPSFDKRSREELEALSDSAQRNPAAEASTSAAPVPINAGGPICRPYTPILRETFFTIKTAPHKITSSPTVLPSLDRSSLEAFLSQHHSGVQLTSLSVRDGCIIVEASLLHSSDQMCNMNEEEMQRLLSALSLEGKVLDGLASPFVRLIATGPKSKVEFLLRFDASSNQWMKVQEAPYEAGQLSLASEVACLSLERKKIVLNATWNGPLLSADSSIEAVLFSGQLIRMQIFPEIESWEPGSHVKISLFLDDLDRDAGGLVNLNVWQKPPPSEALLPQKRVASSSVLLLPLGSEEAVEELQPIMSADLKNDLAGIVWASSSSSASAAAQLISPESLKVYMKAATALIKWAKESHCVNTSRLVTQILGKLVVKSGGKKSLVLPASLATCLSRPWTPYRANVVWCLFFGCANCVGAVKALHIGSYTEFFMIVALAWPYLLISALHFSRSRLSVSRRLLDNAGLMSFVNKMVLSSFCLCFGDRIPRILLVKVWGDPYYFPLIYLTTKTLYTIFEPFDIRAYVLSNILLNLPLFYGVGKLSGLTSLSSGVIVCCTTIFTTLLRIAIEPWLNAGRRKVKSD